MKTPILFLIFNRPDTTEQVFETIRNARPARLYIAADGPRKNKNREKEKCEQARSIISKVDWECEVKTLFRNENLGCGKAVSGALNWFFDQEPEGIILEDDVVPHPDFFSYCEELLEKYRHDDQVRFISGRNHFYGQKVNEDSYFFSSISHVWGWASWSRTWKIYDFELKNFTKRSFKKALRYYYDDPREIRYWLWILFQMKHHQIDSWAYPLTLCLLMHQSLCIIPNTNLTQNIGFREDATHTLGKDDKMSTYKGNAILPLKHPQKTELNKKGDYMDIEAGQRFLSVSRYNYYLAKFYIKRFVKRFLS